MFDPSNTAPDAPVVVAPTDGAIDQTTSPTLEVAVTDADGDPMDVSFYGRELASGNFALIGTDTLSSLASNASIPWAGIGDGQAFEWYASAADASLSTDGPVSTFRTLGGTNGSLFIGTGDMASCNTTDDSLVADVLAGLDGQIFTTGDNVYPNGTAADFTNCYDPVFGPFLSRTRPGRRQP